MIDADELREILRDDREKCIATTASGQPCKRYASEGSLYCPMHDGDRRDERSRAAVKGQKTRVAERIFATCENAVFDDDNSQKMLVLIGRAVVSGDLSTGEAKTLKDLILAAKQIRDSSATQHNGLDGSILGMSDDQLNAFIQAGNILDSADLCIDIEPSKTINRGKNMHQVRIDHHEPRTIDLGDDDIIDVEIDHDGGIRPHHIELPILDCYEELDADKAEELWNALSYEDQVACAEFVRSAFAECPIIEQVSLKPEAGQAIKSEPQHSNKRIRLK